MLVPSYIHCFIYQVITIRDVHSRSLFITQLERNCLLNAIFNTSSADIGDERSASWRRRLGAWRVGSGSGLDPPPDD